MLKTVPKIGKKDAVVEVSEGYARNALFPKRLATPATQSAVAAVARTQQNKEEGKKIQYVLLDKAISMLDEKTFVIHRKASTKGNLFSKITSDDIAAELFSQYNLSINPQLLSTPANSIKQVGQYTITITDEAYHSTFSLIVK